MLAVSLLFSLLYYIFLILFVLQTTVGGCNNRALDWITPDCFFKTDMELTADISLKAWPSQMCEHPPR